LLLLLFIILICIKRNLFVQNKTIIMKNLCRILFISSTFLLYHVDTWAQSEQKIMIVTTVESIIPGGMGRSSVIITDENGKSTSEDLKNFYSMIGITFDNITKNSEDVVGILNKLSAEGWSLLQTSTGV